MVALGQVFLGSYSPAATYKRVMSSPDAIDDVPQTGPIVLELFTSQSCSSCPPADALIHHLSKRENVIALSCHVTYWNHLSWKDSFSREFCSQRQSSFSAYRGSNSRFTPELLVNGHKSMVGSKAYMIEAALKELNGELGRVTFAESIDGIDIKIPLSETISSSHILVSAVYFAHDQEVHMGRGENSGLTVTYTNPVSEIVPLAYSNQPNDPSQLRATILKQDIPQNQKGVAILIQDRRAPYGPILAAGQYFFPPAP